MNGEYVLTGQSVNNGEVSPEIPLAVGVTEVDLTLEKSGVSLNKTVTVRREAPVLGNLNSDGVFTKEDADILSDIISGAKLPDKFESALADLNGDGSIDTEEETIYARAENRGRRESRKTA